MKAVIRFSGMRMLTRFRACFSAYHSDRSRMSKTGSVIGVTIAAGASASDPVRRLGARPGVALRHAPRLRRPVRRTAERWRGGRRLVGFDGGGLGVRLHQWPWARWWRTSRPST